MRMGTEIKDSIWVLYTCGVQISWRWRQLGGKSKNRLNWEISSGGKKGLKTPEIMMQRSEGISAERSRSRRGSRKEEREEMTGEV